MRELSRSRRFLRRRRVLILAAGALAVLTTCTSTTLTHSWRDAGYAGPPFKNVLVMGITDKQGLRRQFEDGFTQRLREHGIGAVASYTLIPDAGKVEDAKLADAVRQARADAVLTTRVLRIDKRVYYSPNYAVGVGAGSFYGFYSSAWVTLPPTVEQYDIHVLETNVFETKGRKLVWSGTTETIPGKLSKDIDDFAQLMVKTLGRQGLL